MNSEKSKPRNRWMILIVLGWAIACSSSDSLRDKSDGGDGGVSNEGSEGSATADSSSPEAGEDADQKGKGPVQSDATGGGASVPTGGTGGTRDAEARDGSGDEDGGDEGRDASDDAAASTLVDSCNTGTGSCPPLPPEQETNCSLQGACCNYEGLLACVCDNGQWGCREGVMCGCTGS